MTFLALGIFTGSGLFLSVLAERLRRSRWAEPIAAAQEQQLEDLERRVRERTAELRQTTDLVQAERQRFQQALDRLPAYLVLLSPDYRVPFANRFFEERFGKSEGRRCYEYLFHRSEPCENCETFRVLKTNAPHHWEWTGPDGRNYDIHDFPFTDSDGSPLIMEVGIDITERLQAEAVLKEANRTLEERVAERTESLAREQANLRAVFDVVNVGMLVVAEDGAVKQVNDTISRWVKKDVAAWEGGSRATSWVASMRWPSPPGAGTAPSALPAPSATRSRPCCKPGGPSTMSRRRPSSRPMAARSACGSRSAPIRWSWTGSGT